MFEWKETFLLSFHVSLWTFSPWILSFLRAQSGYYQPQWSCKYLPALKSHYSPNSPNKVWDSNNLKKKCLLLGKNKNRNKTLSPDYDKLVLLEQRKTVTYFLIYSIQCLLNNDIIFMLHRALKYTQTDFSWTPSGTGSQGRRLPVEDTGSPAFQHWAHRFLAEISAKSQTCMA